MLLETRIPGHTFGISRAPVTKKVAFVIDKLENPNLKNKFQPHPTSPQLGITTSLPLCWAMIVIFPEPITGFPMDG